MAVQPVQRTYTAPSGPLARPSYESLAVRIGLTLLGAALMIVGAFLDWIRGIVGTDLSVRAFWQTSFASHGRFITSAGAVMILLGLIAIVGMAPRTGWLTRFAGVLGIVAAVLFLIQLYRVTGEQLPGLGFWLALGGSVVALIAGFAGARTVVTAAPVPPPPAMAA